MSLLLRGIYGGTLLGYPLHSKKIEAARDLLNKRILGSPPSTSNGNQNMC